MFNKVGAYIRELRISWDFRRYDQVCRKAHEQEAALKYCDSALQAKLASLNRSIFERSTEIYGRDQEEAQNCVKQAAQKQSEVLSLLEYFLRSYKVELDELYHRKSQLLDAKSGLWDEINSLKADKSAAHSGKDAAYRDLNTAKDRIDAWYRRSRRSFFGNAGKELPKHSLFGQSFGDLDGEKYDRDRAYERVQAYRSEIGDIRRLLDSCFRQLDAYKSSISEVFSEIKQVKADRTYMYQLKKQGLSRSDLQREVTSVGGKLVEAKEAVARIKKRKEEYESQERIRCKVPEVQAQIDALRAAKRSFLDSFSLPDNVEKRRAEHRLLWCRQRGTS
ncbi:hypothetical protein E4634_16105 [Mangrovimicrobium sediminis]|uniref:Uncharacterized protein n=1 Tax=Mangrovimicrobium sediminis TaxID=2562682 RepID=A0A4Z0LY27_9GAMM|nr:hypothetical protein [Haliea sp. SAOS-164]TGD72189.1 hypothetical protein E4634_16105 [Haliea sp. SAOS-164]